jgi:hypothetical protein
MPPPAPAPVGSIAKAIADHRAGVLPPPKSAEERLSKLEATVAELAKDVSANGALLIKYEGMVNRCYAFLKNDEVIKKFPKFFEIDPKTEERNREQIRVKAGKVYQQQAEYRARQEKREDAAATAEQQEEWKRAGEEAQQRKAAGLPAKTVVLE